VIFFARSAGADGLPLDITQFPNPNDLVSDAVVKALVKTIGFGTEHRAYEPATPLGLFLGLDVGIEATLVKVPTELGTELANVGVSSASIPPALPIPRVIVHKGLGRIDVGASYIGFKQYKIYGGDVKWAFYVPDEGLCFAVRLNYTKAKVDIVETTTISPQILMSKKIDFADPYVGIGYQNVKGKLTVSIPLPQIDPELLALIPAELRPSTPDLTIKKEARMSAFNGFLGVGMKFGPLPLKITMEMGYSTSKVHTMGAKLSLNF
jgi:hypothetical protein